MGGFRKGGFSNNRFVRKPDVAIASEVSILSKSSLAITDFHAKKTQHGQLFENRLPGTPPFAIPKYYPRSGFRSWGTSAETTLLETTLLSTPKRVIWETKGRFLKGWFWRTYPRSGFRSGGTSAKTTLLETTLFANPRKGWNFSSQTINLKHLEIWLVVLALSAKNFRTLASANLHQLNKCSKMRSGMDI